MPTPTRINGTVASAGYAAGLVYRLERPRTAYSASGHPETEAVRLTTAIAQAAGELAHLVSGAAGGAEEILELQVAMLEDRALAESALAAIATGADAASAWQAAMDIEIAGYAAANDEYFRARVADLRDMADRVLRILCGGIRDEIPEGSVLVGHDATPSTFLSVDWSKGGGIVLSAGSPASHVAMLARAKGVPMLVGISSRLPEEGETILVDAVAGAVTLRPAGADRAAFESARASWGHRTTEPTVRQRGAALTKDGVAVSLLINVAGVNELDEVDFDACDGVGLMRSEFLFAAGMADEESQFRAYIRILQWARGKPVVIRTMDAGGDKPIPTLTPSERNPFLGLRGIRLSLKQPEVFRTQIRALLRAAAHGDLRVMLPMVTLPSELAAARSLFAQEAASASLSVPPLGIMVEVPAVAIAPELFPDAAFFSIGSNDLTQYVMAAARDDVGVASLNDHNHPAVLSLIANVVRGAAKLGVPVSLCGDAAGVPTAVPGLLGAGLRSLSVVPSQLASTRAAIAGVTLGG